jgi:hypothetical protein
MPEGRRISKQVTCYLCNSYVRNERGKDTKMASNSCRFAVSPITNLAAFSNQFNQILSAILRRQPATAFVQVLNRLISMIACSASLAQSCRNWGARERKANSNSLPPQNFTRMQSGTCIFELISCREPAGSCPYPQLFGYRSARASLAGGVGVKGLLESISRGRIIPQVTAPITKLMKTPRIHLLN